MEIKSKNSVYNLFENDKYRIFGLPFYQENQKGKFKEKLEELLRAKV